MDVCARDDAVRLFWLWLSFLVTEKRGAFAFHSYGFSICSGSTSGLFFTMIWCLCKSGEYTHA
jgi:hypothetical protein